MRCVGSCETSPVCAPVSTATVDLCSALPVLPQPIRECHTTFHLRPVPPNAGMTEMSNALSQDAKQFAVKAKDLYHQALFRKYLPLLVLVGVAVCVLVMKFAL